MECPREGRETGAATHVADRGTTIWVNRSYELSHSLTRFLCVREGVNQAVRAEAARREPAALGNGDEDRLEVLRPVGACKVGRRDDVCQ